MARQDYVPQEDNNLATWATHLSTEAPKVPNQTAMNWTPALAAEVGVAAGKVAAAVRAKKAARQAWRAANAAQDAIIAESLAFIRMLVAQGKREPTATEAVQRVMGLLGPESDFDREKSVAVLRGVKAAGGGTFRVRFNRAGGALDAMNLYLRRAGERTWTLVATMLRSPYIHRIVLAAPGVPESYEVRVRGVKGNDEVGLPSDPVVVLVF